MRERSTQMGLGVEDAYEVRRDPYDRNVAVRSGAETRGEDAMDAVSQLAYMEMQDIWAMKIAETSQACGVVADAMGTGKQWPQVRVEADAKFSAMRDKTFHAVERNRRKFNALPVTHRCRAIHLATVAFCEPDPVAALMLLTGMKANEAQIAALSAKGGAK